MRFIATIERRNLTDRILRHLGLSADLPVPWRAGAPPKAPDGFDVGGDLPVPVYEIRCVGVSGRCAGPPAAANEGVALTSTPAACSVRAVSLAVNGLDPQENVAANTDGTWHGCSRSHKGAPLSTQAGQRPATGGCRRPCPATEWSPRDAATAYRRTGSGDYFYWRNRLMEL
jgi:hypothetical protein